MRSLYLPLFMAAFAFAAQFSAVATEQQVLDSPVAVAILAFPQLSLHPPLHIAPSSLTVVPPRPLLDERGEHLFYEPVTQAVAFVYRLHLAGNPITKPILPAVFPRDRIASGYPPSR